MFHINKNHVLPRCKIAKFFIVMLEIARGIPRCSANNCFENTRATMKDFLLKSLKNTSGQVHFYQHFKPVNCAVTEK